jgi:hypothetical protein
MLFGWKPCMKGVMDKSRVICNDEKGTSLVTDADETDRQ